uniref:PBP domain-containing protein n=1 Tax=Magnetococcus massalia (strain MO-1) TaxID=451514 RepID=A0A1S7LFP5_MAGMO|nr:Conserved exported protein of unknown function. Putative ABC-type phosphate transport system, periplasmic component [Candidatus Magnetococcus massalia]
MIRSALILFTLLGWALPLHGEVLDPIQTIGDNFCRPGEGHPLGPGPAFSDDQERVKKSKAWQKRPISYGSWAKQSDLAITLDQHLYAALRPLVEQFARDRGLKIALKEGTCGVSQGLLNRKRVDMAGFCCPPAATDRLPGLRFHTLAISSLAVLVPRDNPLDDLTPAQVRGLFSGAITHWDKIKGFDKGALPDPSVWPLGRLHCIIRPGHWRLILDREDAFSARLHETGSIPNMIRKVASYPNAIGYEVLWDVVRFPKEAKRIKALRIDGVHPSNTAALLDGRYPFYRVHSVAVWEQEGLRNPHIDALLTFLKGKMAHLDSKFHLIPIAELPAEKWRFSGDELVGGPTHGG